MRTDDLIAALAAEAGPVDRGATRRRTAAAAAVGLAAAAALVPGTLGLRPDWPGALLDWRVLAKIAFVVAVVAVSFAAVLRLSVPGRGLGPLVRPLLAPFAAMALVAAVELGAAAAADRPALLLGGSWWFCLRTVPLFALPPFAALVLALRRAAPTDLAGAGFATGLLAGGLGTLAYELHCTEDSMAFVASWYALAMLSSGLFGAVAVPRLVRW